MCIFSLQYCAASQKRSVRGLDNVMAEGLEAFTNLETIAGKLHDFGSTVYDSNKSRI